MEETITNIINLVITLAILIIFILDIANRHKLNKIEREEREAIAISETDLDKMTEEDLLLLSEAVLKKVGEKRKTSK